jgi:hypothetical protein
MYIYNYIQNLSFIQKVNVASKQSMYFLIILLMVRSFVQDVKKNYLHLCIVKLQVLIFKTNKFLGKKLNKLKI